MADSLPLLGDATPRVIFIGTGTRGPFVLQDGGVPIRIRSSSHVTVVRYTSTTDETGTPLVLDVDYTVDNADPDNASITLTVAQDVLEATERLLVQRDQGLEGVIQYASGGNFSARTLGNAIGVLSEQVQEIRRDVDRAITVPWTATDGEVLPLPPTDEAAILVQNTDGSIAHSASLASQLASVSAISAAIEAVADMTGDITALVGVTPYDTLAALLAVNGSTFSNGDVVATRGHTSVNDGCGATYIIYSTLPKLSDGTTDLPVDNAGCINALTGTKWAIHADYALKKIIHPKMFGAKGDGSNQDTQLDNMWDCYADLSQLNPGGSPYSFTYGSRLPEQPEIKIYPGIYVRGTYAVEEFDFEGFSLEASDDAVFVKQGFRFKGNYGNVRGLRLQGSNTANSYGIHQGDSNFDTADGTQQWTFTDCFVEKYAVNWLVTYDVESTYINCQCNAATTINRAILRASDSHWKGYRGTRSGGKWGTLIQPWGTGAFAINVGGLHFEDDAERKAEGRNGFITGGDGTTALNTSNDPYLWLPNGYSTVKVAAAWECYFTDCDWANDSEESQNPTRRNLTVTAMAQSPANAAWTRVTVSTPHFLQHIMDIGHSYYEFTSCGDFSAANGSGNALTIMNIVSTTVFDCDISPSGKASFSGTGNLALPEYNLAIYGQSSGWQASNLNSMKFVGGHANWTLWGRSRNTQFLGFRHKQDIVAEGPGYILGGIVEECFTGDLAAPETYDNNIRIVGPGAIDITRHGSRDFNLVDSVTRTSSDYGHAIERPLASGGIAADGGAAKMVRFANKYDRGEFGITTALTGALTGAYFNETALNFVTADVSGFPIVGAQVKATGSTTNIKLEDRAIHWGFNIKDDGGVSDGTTSDATALTAQLARRPGTTFNLASAAVGEKRLYFPAGRHLLTSQAITTSGTGQRIEGEGQHITRLMGCTITIDDARTSICNLSLSNTADWGIKFTHPTPPSSGRGSCMVHDVHIRDRDVALLVENGSHDKLVNMEIESCGWGLVQTLDGTVVNFKMTNFRIGTIDGWGVYAPDGQTKLSNGEINACGRGGILFRNRASSASALECYLHQITSSGQQNGAFFSITSVADIGGGLVRVTVSSAFYNRVGDDVKIFDTTDYDGAKTIVAISSDYLTFDIAATFTTTKTGKVRAKHDRVWAVTAVASHSAGTKIEITTQDNHDLVPGVMGLTLSGMSVSAYNGSYDVYDVTAANKFVVTKTYTATATGTAAMPNWDIVFDAKMGGATDILGVYDHFIVGGNMNSIKIASGYNINLIDVRFNTQLWIEEGVRIKITRNGRGRDGNGSLQDIKIGGPGSLQGWSEMRYADDNDTDGDGYMVIATPNTAAGVGVNNLPTLNELRVKADGHQLTVNGTAVLDVTSSSVSTTLPVQALSGTAIPAGGTAGSGFKVSSTSNFGVFFGSGAPTLSAAKGSLYLRSDGSTTNDRAYINTNGTTTWTALITAA